MTKSEPILPIRFYSSLYEQNRFNKMVDNTCANMLYYSPSNLPHFQVKRPKSLLIPTQLYLRNVCTDAQENFYKILSPLQAVFSDNATLGPFPKGVGGIVDYCDGFPQGTLDQVPVVVVKECGGIGNPPIACHTYTPTVAAEIVIPVTNGVRYSFKMVVDKFVLGVASTFEIQVWDGAQGSTQLLLINNKGVYTLDFVATGSQITIAFPNFQQDDIYLISYLQAYYKNPLSANLFSSDVTLNPADIKIKPLQDGTDILVYCEDSSALLGDIEPGEYYYILNTGDEIYFSETFMVKRDKDLEALFLLQWWNDCDINNNIIYNATTLSCNYRNKLYLDAALFDPKYTTDEAVKQNGNGDEIPQFRRWQKSRNLDVVCPQFLTDAISAIFLHDNIQLTEPLNHYQEEQSEPIEVIKVSSEIVDVLNESLQRIKLNLVLADRFTRADCCEDVLLQSCTPEAYTSGTCGSEDYELILTGPVADRGLFACGSSDAIEVDSETIIFNITDSKYYKLTKDILTGYWSALRVMPQISNAVIVGLNWVITGEVLPNTWIEIFYNRNGAGFVSLGVFPVDESGLFSYASATAIYGSPTTLVFKIENASLYCDFGEDSFTAV